MPTDSSEDSDFPRCPSNIDPVSWRRWTRYWATQPPMAAEDIAKVAAIFDRNATLRAETTKRTTR
jgi:hypothetical protein